MAVASMAQPFVTSTTSPGRARAGVRYCPSSLNPMSVPAPNTVDSQPA